LSIRRLSFFAQQPELRPGGPARLAAAGTPAHAGALLVDPAQAVRSFQKQQGEPSCIASAPYRTRMASTIARTLASQSCNSSGTWNGGRLCMWQQAPQ